MKHLIKIIVRVAGHSSGEKRKKKPNCGVSTVILLVGEAAPVQYVLEITEHLEEW